MKSKAAVFFASLLLLVPLLAHGETQYYSITELGKAASTHWEKTYKAYGRTIDVNVDIEIPSTNAAPVIVVRSASPINEELSRALQGQCETAMKEDKVHSYSFTSTNFSTSFDHGSPPIWGKSRADDNNYDQVTMSWNSHLLTTYSMDAAYAEDNNLLLGKAVEVANQQIKELYQCDDLKLTNVAIFDRTFYRSNQEKISEKGYYHLEMHQVFHKIPFMGSVHGTFSVKAIGDENYLLEGQGRASIEVWDEESFLLQCCFYEEVDTLYQDIPLLPFDELKYQIEELIKKGYIRSVDSVTLGYTQFDTAKQEEQILIPTWVVWCEYQQEGPRAEHEGPFYTDGWLEDEPYYRPIIINAQTGKMIDPESTDYGRCLMPNVLTW